MVQSVYDSARREARGGGRVVQVRCGECTMSGLLSSVNPLLRSGCSWLLNLSVTATHALWKTSIAASVTRARPAQLDPIPGEVGHSFDAAPDRREGAACGRRGRGRGLECKGRGRNGEQWGRKLTQRRFTPTLICSTARAGRTAPCARTRSTSCQTNRTVTCASGVSCWVCDVE